MKTLKSFGLLFMSLGLILCYSCNDTPIIEVDNEPDIPIIQEEEYGGQIKGFVTMPRLALTKLFPNKGEEEIQQIMLDYLIEKMQLITLEKQSLPLPGGQFFDSDSDKNNVKINAPKVSINNFSNAENLIINYSIGGVSTSGIFSQNDPPLQVLQPYQVSIPRLSAGSAWMDFYHPSYTVWANAPGMPVVYLTTCDRVFEDYSFTGRFSVIN